MAPRGVVVRRLFDVSVDSTLGANVTTYRGAARACRLSQPLTTVLSGFMVHPRITTLPVHRHSVRVKEARFHGEYHQV
jgi:hypothetical protein